MKLQPIWKRGSGAGLLEGCCILLFWTAIANAQPADSSPNSDYARAAQLLHPEQQSQALGENSAEADESWKKLLDAARRGNPDNADSVDTINQQMANFLAQSSYLEPYQQRFTELLKKILNRGGGADKQLENKKQQLQSVESQINEKNQEIRQAQSTPAIPFRINGFGPSDYRRSQLQNDVNQLQNQKSQLQQDINDLQQQVKADALGQSSLFGQVMTYLKQCESFYHFQAEAALASTYLNFIGDDASGSISQYVQGAIERIKRSEAVRPAVAEALKSAQKCADDTDFWQALDKAQEAQTYLLRQEQDPATQDAIKAEIASYTELWNRRVNSAENRAETILQMLDGANPEKAETEWHAFRDQNPYYPGILKTENQILDVIYRNKLNKFQEVLASSIAQARLLLPQMTNDVSDPYMRSLLLARLDAALQEHDKDVPNATAPQLPAQPPDVNPATGGASGRSGVSSILAFSVIGVLVVTIGVLFLKLKNVRKQ